MRILNPLAHLLSAPDVSAEGEYGYDSTRRAMQYHDGVRKKLASPTGFMPFAYPIGGGPTQTTTTARNHGAAGGAAQVPFVLEGHMLVQSVAFWNTDTTLARAADCAIYEDRLDNSNTLDLVPNSTGTNLTWTAGSAALRTITLASAPLYLPPGQYWVIVRNTHATNQLGIGQSSAGTLSANVYQASNLGTSAHTSTLDFVSTGGPAKVTTVPGIRLNGRVFGQATAY